jgi:hypothetical protein
MGSTCKRIVAVLSVVAAGTVFLGVEPNAKADPAPVCSLSSLRGTYGVKLDGIVQVPTNPERKLDLVASVTFDGAGNFNASKVFGQINGTQISTPFAGTYTVSSDCTGAMDLTKVFNGFSNVMAALVVVDRSNELFLVVEAPLPPTNPAIIQVSGEAERLGGRDR